MVISSTNLTVFILSTFYFAESFVDSLYEPDRFVIGKTNPANVFLLDKVGEEKELSIAQQQEKNNLVNDSDLLGWYSH